MLINKFQTRLHTVSNVVTHGVKNMVTNGACREKVLRKVKKVDSVIVEAFGIAYNFTRPHQALDYRTPVEAAGVDYFNKGTEAWMRLVIEQAK
jgi:transposase InsO family protein